MARPQKRGADYFPFDVGFFEDRKIKELRGKFGADGLTLYIYLLCQIYKENGYYIKLDEGFDYVISADLNISGEKIGQIVNFLCKRSLFDDKLFASDKVLTSRGIQIRYQEIVKSRGSKKDIEIDKFWVLKKEETQNYIKVAQFSGFPEINTSFSEINGNFSEEEPHKVNKSKVNKSKVKECMAGKRPINARFIRPTIEEIRTYCAERNNNIDPEVFYDHYTANGWKVGGKSPMKDWKAAIRTWEKNGLNKPKTEAKKPTESFNNYEHRDYDEALLNAVVNAGLD